MQVEVDVKCMQTSFSGHGLSMNLISNAHYTINGYNGYSSVMFIVLITILRMPLSVE